MVGVRRTAVAASSFLVVLGLFSGCVADGGGKSLMGPQTAPPQAGLGKLQVLVMDDSEVPIPQAQVALMGTNPLIQGFTDDVGQIVFNDLTPAAYQVASTKLGFAPQMHSVDVKADETTPVEMRLDAIPIPGIPRVSTIIGHSYFACGLYAYLVTVGNLNVCAWDTNHHPRFEFVTPRDGLQGVLQEVTWTKSSGITSEKLLVYLWYKPVCDPTCTGTKEFEEENGASPVRVFSDLSEETFEEADVPFASMTFPGGDGAEVVFVFQQRMEHYISVFYNALPDVGNYTALPEN